MDAFNDTFEKCKLLDGCTYQLNDSNTVFYSRQFSVHIFADFGNSTITLDINNRIMNYMTNICHILSLIGFSGILATYIAFEKWRNQLKNKFITQTSLTFGLHIIMFIVFHLPSRISSKVWCIILGSGLQYATLASFFWMLVTAIHAYLLFVVVFDSYSIRRFYFKSIIACWGIPFIPIIICILKTPERYKTDEDQYCEQSRHLLTYPGILLPIVCTTLINIILYLRILCSISRKKTVRATVRESAELRHFKFTFFFFFFLGFSWIFGLIAIIPGINRIFEIILWYLFSLTAPLHGFVLFMFFIVLNTSTRNLWMNLFHQNSLMRPYITRTDTTKNLIYTIPTATDAKGRTRVIPDAGSGLASDELIEQSPAVSV